MYYLECAADIMRIKIVKSNLEVRLSSPQSVQSRLTKMDITLTSLSQRPVESCNGLLYFVLWLCISDVFLSIHVTKGISCGSFSCSVLHFTKCFDIDVPITPRHAKFSVAIIFRRSLRNIVITSWILHTMSLVHVADHKLFNK